MKFLVDQCLSPKLAMLLTAAGHDAIHVRERGLSTARDLDVLSLAQTDERIVLTADTDFPSILTLGARRAPSCILFRGEFHPPPMHRRASSSPRCLTSRPSLITGHSSS
jgi:predicted nuclease of predicted toxin-antitoxin system